MGIAAGTRLGPYEIQSALGAGGMGEVYRARDTRLDRTVAIKVLRPVLASDPQLRERFEREARAVAALNHPHICTLYDVGRHEETDYLVMEHLEGETLAERLTRGALPIEEALRYGIEIADALDKAHHAGIVHRDLKPANIFLAGGRRGGPEQGPHRARLRGGVQDRPVAKLLDFGLAKTAARAPAGAGLSMLPTTPPGLTVQGTILGTFQYMAPEQLEGQEADARTDIFAFGVVLYEMLTGRKAFEGKTQAGLIGAILEREPAPVTESQPLAPPMLDRILRRCLAKNPDDRWQTARDLGAELEWARTSESVPVRSRGDRRRLRTVAGIAVVLAAALIATGVVAVREFRESVPVPSVIRFQISVPTIPNFSAVAVSPDGKSLAFVSQGTVGVTTLWIHSLESFATTEMTQARQPGASIAWAPDSRRVAFNRGGDRKVQMLDVAAGAVQDVFDAPGTPRGIAWGELGIVVASDVSQGGGLFSVSSPGAQPRQVLERAGARISQPILVDRGALAFLLTDEKQPSQVCVMDATGAERGCVALAASSIGYSPTGHLLFSRGRTLFAQRFDSQNVALHGDPFAVTNDVAGTLRQYWAVSSAGSAPLLAYIPASGRGDSQFAWFDRSGSRLGLIGEPAMYGTGFDLSANNAYIVAERTGAEGTAAFLIDVARGAATRAPGLRQVADLVWAPDGRRFASQSGSQVMEQAAFGGAERVVFEHPRLSGIEDWSPDGRYVLALVREPDGSRSALAVPVGGGMPIPLARSTGLLDEARFSPDGRWIVYNSDDSGRHEVYVAPLPATGERWPVSTAGGVQGRWRGDGRELYFLALDGTLMAVDFTAGAPPMIGAATRLFETGLQPTYNLDHVEPSADGKRFLIRMPLEQGAQSSLNVVVNWTTLLPN